jgi:hypothetical protein
MQRELVLDNLSFSAAKSPPVVKKKIVARWLWFFLQRRETKDKFRKKRREREKNMKRTV